LKPEGYLIIHLVDRNHFDPVVPGGKPMFIVSPQKFAKERITNSLVKFRSFQYKSDFTVPPPPTKKGVAAAKNTGEKNIGKFVEKITDDNLKDKLHHNPYLTIICFQKLNLHETT
jgi:hypothetical protein